MSKRAKSNWQHWLMPTLSILLIAGSALWWVSNMRRVSKAEYYVSKIAAQNPLLGAERFLRQNGMQVSQEETLDVAMEKPLHAGTLLIAERGGVITPQQGRTLLRWVEAGGVLILPAGEPVAEDDEDDDKHGEEGDKTDVNAPDPISTLLKTGLTDSSTKGDYETITLPGLAYPLRIATVGRQLKSLESAPPLAWGDEKNTAIRAFVHGRGQIVLFNWNRFDNRQLAQADHAELLLHLVRLHAGDGVLAKSLLIVRNLSMPAWYAALWHYFACGIIALGVLLISLLWRALPRFGPLLPEAQTARRALMEHVDASGRWHWRDQAGRSLLLKAMRTAVLARIHRREPGLKRLNPAQQLARLATQYGMDQASLEHALHREATAHPADFTRQIQTLQTLRKHHER